MCVHAGSAGSISTERCATAENVSCMQVWDHMGALRPNSLSPGSHTGHLDQRLTTTGEQHEKGVQSIKHLYHLPIILTYTWQALLSYPTRGEPLQTLLLRRLAEAHLAGAHLVVMSNTWRASPDSATLEAGRGTLGRSSPGWTGRPRLRRWAACGTGPPRRGTPARPWRRLGPTPASGVPRSGPQPPPTSSRSRSAWPARAGALQGTVGGG